jgi:hypothetical protein
MWWLWNELGSLVFFTFSTISGRFDQKRGKNACPAYTGF